MKAKLFSLLLCSAVSLQACQKKSSSNSPAPTAEGAAASEAPLASGIEHCLDATGSACFLELTSGEGRKGFYTTKTFEQKLIVNDGIASMNINPEVVADDDYTDILLSGYFPRVAYGEKIGVNLDIVDENEEPKALPGQDANKLGRASTAPAVLGRVNSLSKFKNIARIPSFKGGKIGGGGAAAGPGFFAKIKSKIKNHGGMSGIGKKTWAWIFGGGTTVIGAIGAIMGTIGLVKGNGSAMNGRPIVKAVPVNYIFEAQDQGSEVVDLPEE